MRSHLSPGGGVMRSWRTGRVLVCDAWSVMLERLPIKSGFHSGPIQKKNLDKYTMQKYLTNQQKGDIYSDQDKP